MVFVKLILTPPDEFCMGKRSRPVQPSGSMRERASGSWELRAYSGVDARTGRERYISRTVRGSRRDASRGLRELVAVAATGRAIGAASSFATLIDGWLGAKEHCWSATTMTNTRSLVKCHLLPRLGPVPVGAVTTVQIDVLLADLSRTGLSAGTVNRIRAVIHAALAQAVRWDWIWSNPASLAGRREAAPKAHEVPKPEIVASLMASLRVSDPVLMLLVRLAATTGARRGELLGLSWSDVDLERGRVRLVHGLVDASGGAVLQMRKTKNANCVDLDSDTLQLVREHSSEVRPRAAERGLAFGDCPVFAKEADVQER